MKTSININKYKSGICGSVNICSHVFTDIKRIAEEHPIKIFTDINFTAAVLCLFKYNFLYLTSP